MAENSVCLNMFLRSTNWILCFLSMLEAAATCKSKMAATMGIKMAAEKIGYISTSEADMAENSVCLYGFLKSAISILYSLGILEALFIM